MNKYKFTAHQNSDDNIQSVIDTNLICSSFTEFITTSFEIYY